MVARVRSVDVGVSQTGTNGVALPAVAALPPGAKKMGPQPGPQTKFAECGADIAIYGGSAGSGKTYALELEPLRNVTTVNGFTCVIFRRGIPAIRNPGSLWDQSYEIYKDQGGEPKDSTLEWEWAGAGKIKFAHLEYEKTVFDWHAAQVALICFDEVTEFTEYQFFYMLSRNRSTCGVRPYVRATCNPDADSWVADFIEWWIDQEESLPNGEPNPRFGFPIPERSGKIRFFVRVGDDIIWGDHEEDLTHEKLGIPRFTPDGEEIPIRPMSVTFIAASIYDNKELLRADPDYLAKLLALGTVERERLLKGNWKIRAAPGLMFQRGWVEVVESLPAGLTFKRGWDLAATEKTQSNNPDATASVKIGKDIMNKIYYVADSSNIMASPFKVEAHMKAKAFEEDGNLVEQWIPQDPAQAGKSQVAHLRNVLDGIAVRATPEVGDKEVRFSAFSATAEAGRVKVLRGPWNNRWFTALESFPDSKAKDDDVDATSRAFNSFLDGTSGLVEYMEIEARRLALEKLAESNTEIPTLAAGGVKVIAPDPNINSLYDMRGQLLIQEKDGSFIVTKKHAEMLVGRSRFKYADGYAVQA